MTPQTKKKVLQFVTGTGAFLAAMGTLPVASEHLPFPPEWRPYIISVGFFAMAARQWIQLLADLFDNGAIDQSYNIDNK